MAFHLNRLQEGVPEREEVRTSRGTFHFWQLELNMGYKAELIQVSQISQILDVITE